VGGLCFLKFVGGLWASVVWVRLVGVKVGMPRCWNKLKSQNESQ